MLEESMDLSFRIENLPRDSHNGVKVVVYGQTTSEMVYYPGDYEIGSTEVLCALDEANFTQKVRVMFKLGILEVFKVSMIIFKSPSSDEIAWKTKEINISPFHILRNNGTCSQILPTPNYNLNTATILTVNAQPAEQFTPCTYFQFAGHSLNSRNNHPINAYFSLWLVPKSDGKLNLPILLYRSEIQNTKDPRWKGFILPNKLLGTSSDGILKITCHNMNSNHVDTEIGYFSTTFYQLLKGSGPMNKYILRCDTPSKKREEMSMELIDIKRAESPICISSIIASGEQFHTTIAIDFSTHNGAANESTSLHATYPSPSLYEKRLMKIATEFKNLGLKTAYLGFGCKIPNNYGHMEMSNCFALNGDIINPFCDSIQQVEAMYRSRAINSLFYAPTNFAPVIAHIRKQAIAAEKIKKAIRFVLVILTNGTITDSKAIKDSIEEITKCSKYPISIVFVGMGNSHHVVNTDPNSPFMRMLRQEGKTANNEIQEKENSLLEGVIVTTKQSIVKHPDTVPRRPPSFGKLEVVGSIHEEGNDECMTDTDLFNALLKSDYTKHRVPDENGVEVTVEFWIQEISSISELTSDFEMDLYVNELWYDKNLNFSHLPSCKENITLDHATLNKVWMPNNCFITTKLAEIHDSPFKNVFFTLFRNGTIWVNYRVKVRGPCTMDLSNFPMDSQNCSLVYLSFNYNNEEVKLRWNNDRPDPVYPLRDLLLPDFDLKQVIPEIKEIVYPAGKWDTLTVTFTFKRRYVWYFMQAFVPTYLTIFVSWIAFSLSPRAIPARTLLGVNAILAQIFQFGSMRNMLPRVSYIKAIDVWILGSMTFVFASLVELAIIGYQAKKYDAKKKRRLVEYDEMMTGQAPIYTETTISVSNHHMGKSSLLCCVGDSSFIGFLKAQQVDFYAKLLFPAFYSLFNIFYWCYYGLSG